MIILLTNDDGIKSRKLQYAKSVLSKYGKVYTVAPAIEQSATGMSLTIGGFHYSKIDEFTYSVEGTPVDCVNLSMGGLQHKPNLVISGINDGYNLGFDTKYSGTLGACFQAQYFGYKTIAFSSDNKGMNMVVNEFEKILKYILENNLHSKEYTLNVNFPRESTGKSKGILHTSLFYQEYEYEPKMVNSKYYPNRKIVRIENLPKDSDAYAFRKGYTSISKVQI